MNRHRGFIPMILCIALIGSLFALPARAAEAPDAPDAPDDLLVEEDAALVVEAMPEEPRAPETMTRALTPALIAMAEQVDQITALADGHRRKGEFAKAEDALAEFPPEKAQDLDGYSRGALAGANFNLGMTYLKRGRYADAAEALERAGRIDTADVKTLYCLGTAYRKQKRYAEAVSALKRAVRLKPDMAPAHFSLGNAYFKQGKATEAESAYREATQKDPKHVPAHFMLGSLAWQQADWAAAADAWAHVLLINPNHAKAKDWLEKAKAKAAEG